MFSGHTWKKAHGVGRLWIVVSRLYGPFKGIVGRTAMREVEPPYRHGTGVYVRLGRTLVEFGTCRRHDFDNADDGLLAAVDGKTYDYDAHEIGRWGFAPQEEDHADTAVGSEDAGTPAR